MTEYVGMFDAKTRFSQIVRMVKATGRRVVVTNRGEAMAVIAPLNDASARGMGSDPSTGGSAFQEIERLRRSFSRETKAANRADIDQGRK